MLSLYFCNLVGNIAETKIFIVVFAMLQQHYSSVTAIFPQHYSRVFVIWWHENYYRNFAAILQK